MKSSNFRDKNGSRLSPFKKLPRIETSNKYDPHPPIFKSQINKNQFESRRRHFIIEKQSIINEENLILIRFHLSDGRCLQKEFHSNDRINDLMNFVQLNDSSLNNISFYLSSGDVPKRQFQDFSLTLDQCQILTRTVLFIDRF